MTATATPPAGPLPLETVTLSRPLPHGSTLLATDPLKTLLAAAPAALANRRIVAVSGNSGCGKTVATEVLATRLRQRVVFVALDRGITDKQVIETIYCAVAGNDTGIASRTRRAELMLHLRHLIAKAPLVLMLDEAQNASLNALELARQLQEHPSANCGLVIAGVNLDSKLEREPMLENRIALRVRFDRIHDEDLAGTLAALNPMLGAYPDQTLLAANAEYCRGELRRWAQVIEWLHKLGATGDPDPVDVEARRRKLEQALTLCTGRQVLLP